MAWAIASCLRPAEAIAGPAQTAPHPITIPALPLNQALAELSRQAGISIGTQGDLPAVRTRPARAAASPAEALEQMLADTGLQAIRVGPTAWRIVRAPLPVPRAAALLPQTAPEQPPPLIDHIPIIVTAAKERQDLREVSRAIVVIIPDLTQRHDASAGTDTVANEVEGMTLTDNGPGRNHMYLRGVADSPFGGTSQSTVAVLLDGVRLTYSAPDPDLRLVDVKRVEVLKGPQGSLYGTGALGGIYQIVTNRADLSATSGAAALGGSMIAGGTPGAAGSAVLNLPLVRGTAALRLVGYGASDGGWVDTGPRKDANTVRTVGGRAGLGVALGGNWRLDLTGMAQHTVAADTRYVYQPGDRSRPDQLPEPHDNDLGHAALHLEGQIGSARLVALTGITWHEVQDQLDAHIGAEALGVVNPALFTDSRKYRVWDNELRASGRLGRLHWLAGVSHVEGRQTVIRSLNAEGSAIANLIDNRQRKVADTAAFANLVLPLAGRVELEGGGRLFVGVIEDRRTTPAGSLTRHLRRTGLTPSTALTWRPRAGRVLFVRYGSAFRQGGLGLDSAGQEQPIRGDRLATLEGGWREQLRGGGTFDLGVYHTWWNNVQSDMLLANGLIETRNVGSARIMGVEATLDLPLGHAWRVHLGGSLQDAQLVRNELGIRLKDTRLPVVPEYSARASLRRDFAWGQRHGWVKATLRYVGPARLSFDPVIDRSMGNYVDARMEARLTVGRFEYGLAASNLLGGTADTFALGNALRIASVREYTPQRPTTISATAAVRF